ncbi:interleukin-2 receptor subunit beta isoform X2 [Marmota marmota marmota]|uniref:interleukin-2 receptor subunit beta isoform X2 n=1 Tax=Marmota marmota marmota TaxID=9994 RepID=UPI002093EC6F|nr:interleukin-2 receptor subunit beta isoform X2 [Marmota marmota marmota]
MGGAGLPPGSRAQRGPYGSVRLHACECAAPSVGGRSYHPVPRDFQAFSPSPAPRLPPAWPLIPCTGSGLALGFQSLRAQQPPATWAARACDGHGPSSSGDQREHSSKAPCPSQRQGSLPQLHLVKVMAAPALSWCHLLLLLLPLASAVVNDTSQLLCFYNSKANISCEWSREGGPQGVSCQLHAKSNVRPWNKTCELSPGRQASWACDLVLGKPDSQPVNSVDVLNISVVCWEDGRWRLLKSQAFRPFHSMRLLAPDSLQVLEVGTHTCNVTWRTSLVSHYIESYLEFEVRTRSPGHSWEEAALLSLRQQQQWIWLEQLTPRTPYELQVRVRPQRGDHTVWSPWSQPLAFRTRPAAPGKETLPLPWFSHTILGLGVAVGLMVSVYFLANFGYIGPWLKKVLKCRIPDPSEFFSQLSSEHGGDLQVGAEARSGDSGVGRWHSRSGFCPEGEETE